MGFGLIFFTQLKEKHKRLEEKKCQRVARWLLPSRVPDQAEGKGRYSATRDVGLITLCRAQGSRWRRFFPWRMRAQAVFRKSAVPGSAFSRGSLEAFLFSFSFQFRALTKLWVKGPGSFKRSTCVLQWKLSIFLSGWIGKEKSVVLCLLKAREERPLAEGSSSRIVDTRPVLRIQISDTRTAPVYWQKSISFQLLWCQKNRPFYLFTCKMPINRAALQGNPHQCTLPTSWASEPLRYKVRAVRL